MVAVCFDWGEEDSTKTQSASVSSEESASPLGVGVAFLRRRAKAEPSAAAPHAAAEAAAEAAVEAAEVVVGGGAVSDNSAVEMASEEASAVVDGSPGGSAVALSVCGVSTAAL